MVLLKKIQNKIVQFNYKKAVCFYFTMEVSVTTAILKEEKYDFFFFTLLNLWQFLSNHLDLLLFLYSIIFSFIHSFFPLHLILI